MSELYWKTKIDELINKEKIQPTYIELEGPTIGEQLEKISSGVHGINSAIDIEREERKAEDDKNMKYTKRMDRINLVIAVLGLAVAVVGVVVAFIALK